MDTWTPGLWANPAENPSYDFGSDTLKPELPLASYDLAPRDWSLSTGATNVSAPIEGVLSYAKATGDSLLSAWGTIQGFQRTKAEMDLARQVAVGDIAVRSAQATSQQEIARLSAETAASVERSRAAAQTSVAQAQAAAARSGAVYVPAGAQLSLPAIVAGLTVAYMVFRGKGKK